MERIKQSGIKSKVVKNLILIVLIMLVLINAFSLIFIRTYFYNNTESMIVKQLDISKSFYNKYYSGSSLLINIYDNMGTFWNHIDGQVQVYDVDGNLLMDSIGVKDKSKEAKEQVNDALMGKRVTWKGKVDYYDKKVISVSEPIESNNEIIGVIRVVTSLEEVDQTIRILVLFFITISLIVFIIALIISLILADSLVKPIKEVTNIAEDMASGDLSIKEKVYKIDEINKLGDTLNLMATEIKKRESLKNEFISSISHELRTPLTAIKGWIITIKEDLNDTETVNMGFDILQNEAERLTAMVEELLDFSRLLNTGVKINKSKENIREFLEDIYYYLKPRSQRDEIRLELVNTDTDSIAYFDSNRMKQVLINLLDNSFRFTNKGGSVSLEFQETNDEIHFIVEDTGIGISKDDLPRVTEKFFKGKESKSQNGIGLSISDEIIKAHGGSMIIESEVHFGTKITIKLPKVKEL